MNKTNTVLDPTNDNRPISVASVHI